MSEQRPEARQNPEPSQLPEASQLLAALEALWAGDLSYRMPAESGEAAARHNQFLDHLQALQRGIVRVSHQVGADGILGGQIGACWLEGDWRALEDQVNSMAANLTNQVRDITAVITAVANGDLARKVSVGCAGEIAALKATINRMVEHLNHFASEVTRIAREAGTDGIFGGQAEVPGLAGNWADVIQSINYMSRNLTLQVRDVSRIVAAINAGEFNRKVTVKMRGEMTELKQTLNQTVDRLSAIIDEVSRVASETGDDGRPGGQSQLSGIGDGWKHLADSVNRMSENLARQRGADRVS